MKKTQSKKAKKGCSLLYGIMLGVSFSFGFQLPFLFWYLYSFYFGQ